MSSGPGDFDMNAAWLRKAQGDVRAFLEGFAARMEGAIPGRVTVERKRDGLFSKSSHVVTVSIATEHDVYVLALDKAMLSARRTKAVRGVTLRSESMPVPDWLTALNREVQVLAEQAGSAQSVLHDFLMS